jgi:hypothetical protein
MSAFEVLRPLSGNNARVVLNPMNYPPNYMREIVWGTLRTGIIHEKVTSDDCSDDWLTHVQAVHEPTVDYRTVATIYYSALSPEQWEYVKQITTDIVLLRWSTP